MRLLVVGAGGHAKVVVETAEAASFTIAAVVGTDTDPVTLLGHDVSRELDGHDANGFIVAIGDNATRAEYFARLVDLGMAPLTVVHPSAVVSPTAIIGPGTLVTAGAVINADARIGANTIVNTGCVVEHDVTIGDHTLMGTLSGLCGGVTVGSHVLLGAGATAIPRARIGDGAIVAAGAVVTSDVAPYTLVAGVPARLVRKLGAGR